MKYPEIFKYTKDHEWALMNGSIITIGITDHAQSSLGDVVYVELPKVGRVLKAKETFGVVESIKAVSDLYSPVAGKVVEVNLALEDHPEKLNKDPHQAGWIIKVEVADASGQMGELMDAKAYQEFVES